MTRPGGRWRNWARTERVRPRRIEHPPSVEAVQRAVRAARDLGLTVRAVGAGHSFSAAAVAPGVLLDLADLSGLVSVDADRRTATFRAGTRLHRIPRLLEPHGLAMENLGDIDRQTLAGAISTGTHGTGSGFTGLAGQVEGVTMVTADGEILRIDADRDPGMLPAAALSLGALGILVEVTLRCVPAFLVHAVERPEPLGEVIDGFTERAAAADHFEFYWFPHSDTALTKTNTRLPADAPRRPLRPAARWIDEEVLANGLFRVTCAAGRIAPAIVPGVNRIATRLTGDREYTDSSHRVFTQHRGVRFRELEYAIPLEAVPAAFAELRRLVSGRDWRISFPVEVRCAAADELWLSTAYGRASGYIAVHRYWRDRDRGYFEAVERIMRAHDGRPHWGKLHSLDAADLARIHPRFGDMQALRDRMDPDRVFQNGYLERVLGA